MDLETRVFTITGLKMAADAAIEAEDNVSDTSSLDEDESKENYERKAHQTWKRLIYRLSDESGKGKGARARLIREIIISAMAIARKAHLNEILKELRSALLLHRPSAGAEAKAAALKVLAKHGGYTPADEDSDSDIEMTEIGLSSKEDETDSNIESLLCNEAVMMTGCLNGNENADRADWTDLLKSCKTLSRFAVVAQLFMSKGNHMLSNLETKRDNLLRAIKYWEGTGKRTRRGKDKYGSDIEIWGEFTFYF